MDDEPRRIDRKIGDKKMGESILEFSCHQFSCRFIPELLVSFLDLLRPKNLAGDRGVDQVAGSVVVFG